MEYPYFFRARQQFDRTSISNIKEAVHSELSTLDLARKVKPGETVGVAIGSRGLCNLHEIVAATIEYLRKWELRPRIIPAMGSHGGATGPGQAQVLHDLGISESSLGVPVVSHMDVVSLGKLTSGAEVHFARDALEPDHLVVINRVKPHTAFRSRVESGLCKMLAVGCGRRIGASHMHKFDLAETIVPAARLIRERVSVLFGLALVENARHETMIVRASSSEEFEDTDEQLLEKAWEVMPKIPVEYLDCLIVDEIGKDISGAGMDPNIVGFWRRGGGPRKPDYRIIAALDLTPASHGNAVGIGMADLTSRRLARKIDTRATYTNALTSGVLRSVMLPITLENDGEILETVLNMVPYPEAIRMARIRNTLELETFWVTRAMLPELRAREGIAIDAAALTPEFDDEGSLLPFPDAP